MKDIAIPLVSSGHRPILNQYFVPPNMSKYVSKPSLISMGATWKGQNFTPVWKEKSGTGLSQTREKQSPEDLSCGRGRCMSIWHQGMLKGLNEWKTQRDKLQHAIRQTLLMVTALQGSEGWLRLGAPASRCEKHRYENLNQLSSVPASIAGSVLAYQDGRVSG